MPASAGLVPNDGKFTGLAVDLMGLGRVRLTERISLNGDVSVYRVSHPGAVVKVFDLEPTDQDEVSYSASLAFNLEKENFQDIDAVDQLRRCIPAFYGAHIDYEKKYACIAMEYLAGQNLMEWRESKAGDELNDWGEQFRAAIYDMLSIVTRFHQHGIFLIDFKPDNVIRLHDGRIKFVDLGAFFTPRHSQETDKYVYSATPDYAELVIDTSNVQTGRPLNQSSDIFAAGVALFEMSTGRSRLAIADATGEQLLALPELYRFRDSQIKDVWRAYPHLKEVLPLVETQLRERQIIFAEIWYLIKGLLGHEMPDWDALPESDRQQLILETGTNLIADQLPWKLDWLSNAIARATTLRGLRLRTVGDLIALVANPIPEQIRDDIVNHSALLSYLADTGVPGHEFVAGLNTWEVRCEEQSGHWAILLPAIASNFRQLAPFTFLRRRYQDAAGHNFFQIVSDGEADQYERDRLTMEHLDHDYTAWIGS